MTARIMNVCGYFENYRTCGAPAAYEVQFDGRKHWLCERHSRREYHPPDLHKKLPGYIQRATRAFHP